ncbi:deoxyribonuclease gamma-like [Kryptolebias marmoratus]|uniref:deoxyribonuclease gamma-like n=1 Tax=Kryptolebias marmoratus TaxID=37003 RepID=UPI0018ACE478|nr:deoxyribonuclease gamma-like [Kryptolebias marmoratus]
MTTVSLLLLLLSFLLGVSHVQGGSEFRICAFNLHHFGESKSKKSDVMQTLAKIITRCDICLLQEVRDSKGKAVPQLLQTIRRSLCQQNVMLLGDFNADCSYLAKKNRKKVRLITDASLYWLIPENSDTTVRASTSCVYDRIVVHGETFNRAVVPSSARAFNFQQEYKLTEDQALDVSDHFPVEVLLKVVRSGASSGGASFTNYFPLFAFIPLILQEL